MSVLRSALVMMGVTLGSVLGAPPLAADEIAEFYRGRTVTITSASAAGGGYGVYALLLAEHIGRHIPGRPTVVVSYSSGAGGVMAADYAYNVAPRDGSWILAPLQSLSTLQLVGRSGIRFDAARFHWIGRAAETTSGMVVSRRAAADLKSLLARREDIVVGITQAGAPNHIQASLLQQCPGVRMKIVSGYKASQAMALAFLRNEVDGLALPLDSLRTVYPDILKETMISQSGLSRARDLPHVPLTVELCPDAESRRIAEFYQVQEEAGRSYALPPGTPPARVAALRAAFDAVMKDPALLAQAKERKLDINPLTGAEVQRLVERHIASESALIDRARQAVGLP